MPPFHVSEISPVEMAFLRAKIEALPKKKQEKWHAAAKNEEGTLRQIRFFNGNFQIKVLANSTRGKCIIPANGWAPMVECGKPLSREQIIDAYGEEMVKALEESTSTRIGDCHVINSAGRQQMEESGLLNKDYRLGMMMVMNKNHTGNHHRNKMVNIPARAGQPVRG